MTWDITYTPIIKISDRLEIRCADVSAIFVTSETAITYSVEVMMNSGKKITCASGLFNKQAIEFKKELSEKIW